MGFWDKVLRARSSQWLTPNVTYAGLPWLDEMVNGMTPAGLWKTQPHLRTVVSFRCENVSQLGAHLFTRKSDGGRVRSFDSPAARTLSFIDGQMTINELIYATVGDIDLYDRAYWWVTVHDGPEAPFKIRRLPPMWVSEEDSDIWGVKTYSVGTHLGTISIPASEVLAFPGYDPSTTRGSSPAIDALKDTLKEQISASAYRSQVWKLGGRVSAIITRPKDAPKWSPEAKKQFKADWYSKFSGNGPQAGGTPILEDGMTYEKADFSAKDQEFVAGAKLAFQTVCGVYHINPSMVGQTEGTSGRSVREYRKALYGDNLGPVIRKLESRINHFLLPKIGGLPTEYFEFNLLEKISGDFIEQGQLLSTSVGGPWMTRNEARAKQNMPAIEGGDELIVPLNVVEGGQASPQDTGTQNLDPNAEEPGQEKPKARRVLGTVTKRVPVKATPSEEREALAKEHEAVLKKFFTRQAGVVKSRLGAKSPDWWDEERWDTELAADLLPLHQKSVAAGAARVTETFDPEYVKNYLGTTAVNNAKRVNATTAKALEEALDSDDPDEAIDNVFSEAAGGRSEMLATSAVTFALAFGMKEGGKQAGAITKTWVTGSNPRISHAMMDGETVGIDEMFSNGCDVPGSLGDPDGYGCNCSMDINYP